MTDERNDVCMKHLTSKLKIVQKKTARRITLRQFFQSKDIGAFSIKAFMPGILLVLRGCCERLSRTGPRSQTRCLALLV